MQASDASDDALGNQVLIRDPLGRETRFDYDDQGQQLSRTLPLGLGPDGTWGTADDSTLPEGDFTERMEYDARGRQTLAVSFEGKITRFVYDDGLFDENGTVTEKGTGRLKAQQFFDNYSDYLDYVDNGSGTPAETIEFTYDSFGRLVAVTDPRGETTHDYDVRGQLVRAASPEGAVNYEYDDLGRKTRTFTGPVNDPVNDFTYGYDALGRLANVTVVERNDVPLAQQEVTAYAYDLQGNLDLQTSPDGVITDYTYDELNRLTDLVHYLSDGPAGDPETLADNDKLAEFNYEVRADGRRTNAAETFWFDNEAHQNVIQWQYDDAGRLIDEVFNHYDDDFDQTQHFTYDLVGNRLSRTLDSGNDASIDQVFASSYDANDRLTTEQADTDNDSIVDETTTHGYTGTQQTSKSVAVAGQTTQSTAFAYDLQGRMQQVLISSYDGATLTRREQTTYDYDSTGIRVSALHEIDSTGSGTGFDTQTRTSYLVDHRNFTGYQQVLEEIVTNEVTSELIKKVVYTIGHDQISQTTFTPTGDPEGETLVFHVDGHGSTRILTDLAAAIATLGGVRQIFHFDAYGNAIGFNPALVATAYLYSGEQFDARIGQQYLRARYYDPATGRFNRLDPFFGNLNDPQSFHKYLYTHADPVNGWDPTGMFEGLVGMMSVSGITSSLRGSNQGAIYAAKQAAWAGVETGFEVLIGNLISMATGIPFEPDAEDLGRSFGTNFAVNLVTSGLGHADRLRNLLDFGLRTLSDVIFGQENLWWSAAVNLGSLAGSAMLAKYGKKILGRSIAKWGGCFVAGTPVVIGYSEAPSEVFNTKFGRQSVETARRVITKTIETVELGSRVITEAPEGAYAGDAFGEPDQQTWRTVRLLQQRSDGTEIEMELLRPTCWLKSEGIEAGQVINLQFPELQTSGWAKVLGITECPSIMAGEGHVVIGRFVTRNATNLVKVTLEDGENFTGTTNHPIWSIDAGGWKPLEELTAGERLQTLDGDSTVATVCDISRPADVFNIEVQAEHVYRIMEFGVLVHNADYVPDEAVKKILAGLRDIPWGQYRASGCDEVAAKINAAIGGTVYKIYPKLGSFLGDRQGFATSWPYHAVNVKDGWVYDALTGIEGVPIEVFKKLWKHHDDIDFNF